MKRHPRQEELLAQRALHGLTDAELGELNALGGGHDESLELAAAALTLARLPHEQLPSHLAARILASAQARPVVVAPIAAIASIAPARASSRTWPAWLAAAACLVLAAGVGIWARRRPPVVVRVEVPVPASVAPVAPSAPTPAEERAELLATASDVTRIDWKTTKDAAGKGASGDVVWSPSDQRGFMRFVGLHPNDRAQAQYQLWIFDKDRDARYPVDGGVFDVPASGEVVVPITARLHVDQPTLFAVTIEKPGGVVVSKREHIVVTAAASG
jgi:hypothetical protein